MTNPSSPGSAARSAPRLDAKVVICGSFRRDPDGLRAAHRELRDAGAEVLSPTDPQFVREEHGFVFAAHEVGEPPSEVEARHIRAMLAADFVWLHAPGGYVGPSAAMELGVAHALDISVYTDQMPREAVLTNLVTLAPSPAAAARAAASESRVAPTRSLSVLQSYYRSAAASRGWSHETPQEAMLLLAEEVGELSRALRKTRNGTVHAAGEDPALELADVALYVVHLANVLAVDLGAAVTAKEMINADRFGPVAQPEAA